LWAAARWLGIFFNYEYLDPLSLIPLVAAVTMLAGGWRGMKWAWPAIVFLFFMIPLPGVMEAWLREPLQWIGTEASVWVIQTLGMPAMRSGNVINLLHAQVGVVEACSGLRMLMLFFTMCVGAAFVVRVSLWEKLVMLVSAIPIALLCNVARITVTAILHEVAHRWPSVITPETAEYVFHDLAGLLMPPLALLMLWGEMALISKLLLPPLPERPVALSGPLGLAGAEDAPMVAGPPRQPRRAR
jgi:exosortase